MPEATPSLFDAINAGIAEANTGIAPVAAAVEPDDTSTETNDAIESAELSNEVAETGADASDEGASGDQPGAEGDVKEADAKLDADGKPARGADGKFVKKEAPAKKEEAPELTAEQKAEAEAKKIAAAAKKPADVVNDPIPKDLKKETSERMTKLVNIAKQKDTAMAKMQTDIDTIMKPINESGATPEQYGAAFSLLKLMNSDSLDDKKKALQMLQSEVSNMAKLCGVPVAGVDMLAEARANELAAARESQKANNAIRETTNVQTAQQKAYKTAQEGLNALEETLKADPSYMAKRQAILPAMQEAFKHIPPSQWVATFKAAYERVAKDYGVAPVAAKVAPKPAISMNQPLRGKVGAVGASSSRAPTSMLEAIEAGINAVGR
jgi:hypothetical protein